MRDHIAELLRKSINKYQYCTSYADTGRVTIRETSLDEGAIDSSACLHVFHVSFMRPDDFGIEFAELPSPDKATKSFTLTAKRDAVVLSRHKTHEMVAMPTLYDGLIRITGIGFGVPLLICKLLLPEELPGASILEQALYGGEFVIEDDSTVKIQLNAKNGTFSTITVGKSDCALLSVSQVSGRSSPIFRQTVAMTDSILREIGPLEGLSPSSVPIQNETHMTFAPKF